LHEIHLSIYFSTAQKTQEMTERQQTKVDMANYIVPEEFKKIYILF